MSTYSTEFCISIQCMLFLISDIYDYTLTVEGEIIASGSQIWNNADIEIPEENDFHVIEDHIRDLEYGGGYYLNQILRLVHL